VLFRGVVIEGVTCAGKSALLGALLGHPAFVRRAGASSLVLTEHHTQRVLESLGPRANLRLDDHLTLLRSHVDYLAGIATSLDRMTRWTAERRTNARFLAILERFHLTHVIGYPHVQWQDVADLDATLATLGVHLCVLRLDPAELRRRIRSDRSAGWGTFLAEPGHRDAFTHAPDDDEKAEHFTRQQERLLTLAARSRMPRLELDTTTLSPAECARRVLDVLLGERER
jgi:thymidylate kinase